MCRKLTVLILCALLLPISLVLIACGDDNGDAADPAAMEVEQTVRGAIEAYNQKDLTRFLSYWTDDGLREEFGVTRAELVQAGPAFFDGPPLNLRGVNNTDVSGDSAETDVELAFGKAVARERFELVREDSGWKIAGSENRNVGIPSGTSGVDVELDEFSFTVDTTEIEDGNIAFQAENVGDQAHELVVLQVPADFNLAQALHFGGNELPAGVQVIGGVGPIAPDDDQNLVFTEPLASGKYIMVCLLPDTSDPQGRLHVAKGMAVEFAVPAQGGGR
jgi:hypothetical protein